MPNQQAILAACHQVSRHNPGIIGWAHPRPDGQRRSQASELSEILGCLTRSHQATVLDCANVSEA